MSSAKIKNESKRKSMGNGGIPRLSDLCMKNIVTNLEKYTPKSFSILDEYQWDEILKLRHKKTKPLKGKGGIDGTGRQQPAVTDKFMLEVEKNNPQLQQSICADLYVWKDCVNCKFKMGGLSRPGGLEKPWPVLLASLEDAILAFKNCLGKEGDEKVIISALDAIKIISESPMDLDLLKSSGIGKKVKKFLGKSNLEFLDEPFPSKFSGKGIHKTPRRKLEATLQSWKDIAAESGVKMKPGESSIRGKKNYITPKSTSYLSVAKKCYSWRTLYQTLKVHDEDRRSKQGEKMRENRRRLDKVRPKVVKVRSASYKQDKILNRQSFGQSRMISNVPSGSAKIRQLRMEATVTSTRRSAPSSVAAPYKPTSNFGAAVSVAATGKKVRERVRKTAPAKAKTMSLAGGKRISVPDAKTASTNVQKRLRMLKKGQSNFRF